MDNEKMLLEELEYWQVLGDILGWRVLGWTFRNSVTYVDHRGRYVAMTGSQRDDIMRAVTGPRDP